MKFIRNVNFARLGL